MKERVLAVRFSSLGDVILASAVASALPADRYETDFLTKTAFAPVLEGHPGIRRIHRFEGESLPALGLRLRREGYGRVLDLHGSVRSRFLSLFFPGRVRRYDGRRRERERIVRAKERTLRLSRLGDYLATVADLPGARPSAAPRVFLRPEEFDRAEARLREAFGGGDGPLVAFAPGARWETKKWGAERYAELAGRLAGEMGARVFAVGSDADVPTLEAVAAAGSPASRIRVLSGTLRESAALLSRAAVLVTNDSGAMHLGAAVGTRVVALFGPTVPELGFQPAGEGHATLGHPLDCRPCTLHGDRTCPLGHHDCMRRIEPREVAEAVRRRIGPRAEETPPPRS